MFTLNQLIFFLHRKNYLFYHLLIIVSLLVVKKLNKNNIEISYLLLSLKGWRAYTTGFLLCLALSVGQAKRGQAQNTGQTQGK